MSALPGKRGAGDPPPLVINHILNCPGRQLVFNPHKISWLSKRRRRRTGGGFSRQIESRATCLESERHAIQYRTFETDQIRRYFQTGPLPRWWQRTHITAAGGAL